MAGCDLGGSGGDGRVAAQFTFDAYGDVLTADHLHAHAHLKCGHKGLFVDRLDVGVVTSGGVEQPRLVPSGHLLVHNRNRTYIPQMGRFLQQDPNATAAVLMESAASHGRGLAAMAAAFSMEQRYGDGGNLYEYLGSSPWQRSDPMGLSWDPFSMVDEYVAEGAGSTAAFMERIVGGAKVAAYVGAVILSQLPFPLASTAADIGASMLEGGMPPDLIAARKFLGYAALGSLAAMGAKLVFSATKAAVQYLAKYGLRGAFKNMWNATTSLAKRVWNWRSRKEHVPGACGCFAAGTLVWTMTGLVPIEQVRTGDFVLSREEGSPTLAFKPVTAEIVTKDAALLELVLRHSTGREETIQTTDEHPFFVPCKGWVRADVVQPGDEVRTVGGSAIIVAQRFGSTRTTVYNLTVDGHHTYHVGQDGVLVHNCIHGHHAWPKFLDGPIEQSLVRMPRGLHEQFHGDLWRAIGSAGISKPRDMKWKVYFAKYPDHYDLAITKLWEVSAAYDAKWLNKAGGYSDSLVQTIYREMLKD